MYKEIWGGSMAYIIGSFIILLIGLAVFELHKAPMGYEDETGFHYGVPPEQQGII